MSSARFQNKIYDGAMTMRDKSLGKQLRASWWDASTLARRAYVFRANMARALVGDTGLSLHVYSMVEEQLEVSLEFMLWRTVGQPLALGGVGDTAVDHTTARLAA